MNEQLINAWLEAKADEANAVCARRAIEDQMAIEMQLTADSQGTKSQSVGQYTVKVTQRIDTKVDADLVQELAAENGLSDHLSSLFRWKPELNKREWDRADESITRPLAAAITAKPGRPSFSIVFNETTN